MNFKEYKETRDKDSILNEIAQSIADTITNRVVNENNNSLTIFKKFLQEECKCEDVSIPPMIYMGGRNRISFKPPIDWISEITIVLNSDNYEEFAVESVNLDTYNREEDVYDGEDLYNFYLNYFN